MDIYEFKDYRSFIRFKMDQNKAERGYQASLARAAGCQQSLLSKVLSSQHDLTRDHGASICLFWGLDDSETEYFMALLDLARAATSQLRALTEKKITRLKTERKIISQRIKADKMENFEALVTYYSAWFLSAIHICATIAEFQTPEAIAKRLRLSIQAVKKTLQQLEQMGLVRKDGSHWTATKKNLHLDENSVMRNMNHLNWRQKAMANIEEQDADALHFSSVLSISRTEALKIREMISQYIVNLRGTVVNSPAEEIYCLNCDFFRI